MPLSAKHKQRSRKKIIASAATLFTERGFDNISIDQIMAHAKMTRGAFYAHFSSKSDLYKESIISAALGSRLAQKKPENTTDQDWIKNLISGYLSLDHVDGKEAACPLAFLTTDIAIRDKNVRDTYTNIYKTMNKLILGYSQPHTQTDEKNVMAVTAMMIGAIALGRSLTDRKTTEQLLDSCNTAVLELLNTC